MNFNFFKNLVLVLFFSASNSLGAPIDNLLNFNLKNVDGTTVKLSDSKNSKLFLIVNTASKCGYTSQYEGLESLNKKYKDKGLLVIGFPSNDFGAQEPGTNQQIKSFCKINYGVSFPLMVKGSVTGPEIQPFFKNLLNVSSDKTPIKWNFEKFLFSKDGKTFKRYNSKVKPEDLENVISKLL